MKPQHASLFITDTAPAALLYDLNRVVREAALHAVCQSHHLPEFNAAELGTPQSLKNHEDLILHIGRTLADNTTKGFFASAGREIFYNTNTNTLVILDPFSDHGGGTCFRPSSREKNFDKYRRVESYNLGYDVEVITGGHSGLHGTAARNAATNLTESFNRIKEEREKRAALVRSTTVQHTAPETEMPVKRAQKMRTSFLRMNRA